MDLLLATSNRGKIMEITEALGSLPVHIVTPTDLGISESPVEHGDTFEANALEKARFYFSRAGMPALSDDSGIIVEALQNELGIHTRRWGAGRDASDEEWINVFLERMKAEENKRARFICVLAYLDGEGQEHLFEGMCDGVITDALEADYLPGLPISACFRPDGFASVYSALSLAEKNAVSHRGRALTKFREHMERELADSQHQTE